MFKPFKDYINLNFLSNFDTIISNKLSYKLVSLAVALFLPLISFFLIFNDSKVDLVLIFIILSLGILFGMGLLYKSIKDAYIPYFFLQLILLWIFLDKKLLGTFGLNFKTYALIFGLGIACCIIYIITNFKFLWGRFIAFRMLLFFFFISIFYFLFYHSDFRSWYSIYMDMWVQSPQVRYLNLSEGISVFNKEFGETDKVGMYLGSLIPIVCFTVGSMLFVNISTLEDFKTKMFKIISSLTLGMMIYFGSAIIFLVLGLSTIGFFDGRLWGDFMGFGHSFPIYLSYYVILFAGFKIYLLYEGKYEHKKLIDYSFITIFTISILLIILQINKTVIISLTSSALIALSVYLYFLFFNKKIVKNGKKSITSIKIFSKFKVLIVLSILVAGILFIGNSDFGADTLERITSRFSTTLTLSTRETLWVYFLEEWWSNLDLKSILFGHGIDSAREMAFMISSMLPGEMKLFSAPQPHIHNFYFDLFYDYGLIACLYFGSIFFIAYKNIYILLKLNPNFYLKLFCVISLSTITFFSIFNLTEIVRLPIAIVFFSLLGFLESAKEAATRISID